MKDNGEGKEFTPSFSVGEHKKRKRRVMLSMMIRDILDQIKKKNIY